MDTWLSEIQNLQNCHSSLRNKEGYLGHCNVSLRILLRYFHLSRLLSVCVRLYPFSLCSFCNTTRFGDSVSSYLIEIIVVFGFVSMGIMDQIDKECCSYDEMGVIKKCCADCKTTKTPLWRGGPNGPKTLCNACGIRYRKRRGCCKKGQEKERKREKSESDSDDDDEWSEFLRMKLVALGEEVFLHSVLKKEKRIKLGEEEEAAVCLMALSCGFVFA